LREMQNAGRRGAEVYKFRASVSAYLCRRLAPHFYSCRIHTLGSTAAPAIAGAKCENLQSRKEINEESASSHAGDSGRYGRATWPWSVQQKRRCASEPGTTGWQPPRHGWPSADADRRDHGQAYSRTAIIAFLDWARIRSAER